MYLIIHLEHLCVTLILIMWTDFIRSALGYQFVRGANDSRIFCLITSVRVQIIYGAASASSRCDIVAELLICVTDTCQALRIGIYVTSPGFSLRQHNISFIHALFACLDNRGSSRLLSSNHN